MIKKFEEFINEGIIMKTIKRSLGKDTRKEDDITLIIKDFMDKRNITDYIINPDKSVDVNDNIKIEKEDLIDGKIPFKFGKVSGYFNCRECGLTTLEGSPKKVGVSFYCNDNQLTSLEGGPEEIGGSFNCSNNQLTSLEGGPQKVGNHFYCGKNQLTSLEGCPDKIYGEFICYKNQLTSLEGCPKEVGSDFVCYNNNKRFTGEEVKQYCKVKGDIYV